MKLYVMAAAAILSCSTTVYAQPTECMIDVICSGGKAFRANSTAPDAQLIEGLGGIKKCVLQEADKTICEKMCNVAKASPVADCVITQMNKAFVPQGLPKSGALKPYAGQEGGFKKQPPSQ